MYSRKHEREKKIPINLAMKEYCIAIAISVGYCTVI